MRYADADHINRTAFHARLPGLGQWYRLAGYVLLVLCAVRAHPACSALLCAGESTLIAAVVMWFLAWYRQVGACWRTSLVAAALVSSVQYVIARGGL